MSYRKSTAVLFVLALALAQFGFGQIARPHAKRQLGYVNPITGQFEPLKQTVSPEATPAVTPTTGTLTFHFKITLKSAPPANTVVSCTASATAIDVNSGQYFDEEASGIATGSGSSYTCNAVIHYSWLLSSPTTNDMINLSSSAAEEYGYQVTATNGSGTIVVPVESRLSLQPDSQIPVPASGASTTENISVTL